MNKRSINVIGGGLAGVEAAWQAAEHGARVKLYEMRPVKQTPAHRTEKLAEIVCSNSLKSDREGTAPYLLKEELRRGKSLVMGAAHKFEVPAGAALAVDRIKFADYITEKIEKGAIGPSRIFAGCRLALLGLVPTAEFLIPWIGSQIVQP